MNYLFLALLLVSSMYAVYPYSLPTFTLKKECASVTQEDITITCPPRNNAHAYAKNFEELGNPKCDITIICARNDLLSDNYATKYVKIQILP